MIAGSIHTLLTGQVAADSGDLPDLRFVSGGQGSTRFYVTAHIEGTGALTVTLQLVIRRPLRSGYAYDAADLAEQYVKSSDEWAFPAGSGEINDWRYWDVPPGYEVALRVKAITGTGAAVSAEGMFGNDLT